MKFNCNCKTMLCETKQWHHKFSSLFLQKIPYIYTKEPHAGLTVEWMLGSWNQWHWKRNITNDAQHLHDIHVLHHAMHLNDHFTKMLKYFVCIISSTLCCLHSKLYCKVHYYVKTNSQKFIKRHRNIFIPIKMIFIHLVSL